MSESHPQIPFSFRVQQSYTFDNFVVGNNQLVIEQIKTLLIAETNGLLYLWGEQGSGCSHLLQAACQQAGVQRKTAIYLPMSEIRNLDPEMLEGIEGVDLVCIDHLQAVVGDTAWEEALFHLFNRVLAKQTALLISGNEPPRGLGVQLPDLLTRLSSCSVFQLQPLDDDSRLSLLVSRAGDKGMELAPDVAQYILNRSGRCASQLLATLDQLDHSSLSAGRKLTIPFVKESMGW